MYIIILLFNLIGVISMNHVINNYKKKYNTLAIKYNKIYSDFVKYENNIEFDDRSSRNRLVQLRIEYAKFKINYKQLLNENLLLREENINLQYKLDQFVDKNSPVIV